MERSSDEEIYLEHSDALMRYAVSLVGRNDASDIVSQAVVNALGSDSWPKVNNHKAYLYRAVLNQAKKTHRDRRRRWSKELRQANERNNPSEPEYRPEVLEAILKLSPRQRAATYLAYWEQLTVDEIADHLGVSTGTVRRHLARARSKLRTVLYAWEPVT